MTCQKIEFLSYSLQSLNFVRSDTIILDSTILNLTVVDKFNRKDTITVVLSLEILQCHSFSLLRVTYNLLHNIVSA